MALIPAVGRRSPQMRALVAVLYLLLSLGAVTMVYPFLVMLGSSVTSQYDQDKYDVAPGYLRSERALYGKYVEDKFGGDFNKIGAAYGIGLAKWDQIAPPPRDPALAARWDAFVAALPPQFKYAGFGGDAASYSPSLLLERYQAFLSRKFHGDIRALDRAYTEEDETFQTVFPPFEQPAKRTWTPDLSSPKIRDWQEFQKTLPTWFFWVSAGNPIFQRWLKEEAYPNKIADLNKAWGTAYTGFDAIPLTARPAGNAAQRKDWETFVRTKMPFRSVRVAPSALPAYQTFLAARRRAPADALPDPTALPSGGRPLLDWLDFLKAAPLASLSVDTPELRWGGPVGPAAQASDWATVQARAPILRHDFVTRNYRLVWQFLALHGSGVWVTVVYCLLAVLTALIVNPLCAYALSRFPLPYGQSVLLFLLATMAFPAEVTMIPNFLLLKHLGLLNTFAALILPGAASGFSIFLMKGFFDSLPKELYEAGTLDGAGEMRMFWTITLPLSRPIFAVMMLNAFTAAYTAFMFAMLTCQDSRMWTLMVWIYEMQTGGAPQYVMMAALTLATVPTLAAFLLAQKHIMKGIVLPSFK